MFRLKYRIKDFVQVFLPPPIVLTLHFLAQNVVASLSYFFPILMKLLTVLMFGFSMQVYAAPTPLNNVSDIATGSGFSCAVTSAGKVRCWGSNTMMGVLGDGTVIKTQYPSYVIGIYAGATAVSAGTNHACAIVNGGVKCWGNNDSGQLGTGNTTGSNIALDVSGLGAGSNVTKISAGDFHTCAIVSGAMKCWGKNGAGQLGDNSTTQRLIPTSVSGLSSGVTDIATAKEFTCAVVSGAAQCWGVNNRGQLGDGTVLGKKIPTAVSGLSSGVTAIDAKFEHACAVVNAGVQCWGWNKEAQLGDGSTIGGGDIAVDTDGKSPPVQTIPSGNNVIDVTMTSLSSCALFSNGAVQCWGSDNFAQLANGIEGSKLNPFPTMINSGMTKIDGASDEHYCAIVDGKIQCWGQNDNWQSGGLDTPPAIVDPPAAILDNLCLSQTEIPVPECEALVSLYVATQGHNWSDKVGNSWLKTNTPCTWSGISCLGITVKHVSAIERSERNLTGIMPNLSALTELQNLYLSNNNLTGDLQGVTGLSNLLQLKLDSNKLTGLIPNLPSTLTNLQLQKNALIGQIPNLTALTALSNADFGYNALGSAASDMTSIDSNWLDTQTIPVTNVTASSVSATEIQINWTPIAYTGDGGYYTIRYGTSSGTYTSSVNTTDKTISSKNITGLITDTTYYFAIETYTPTFAGQANALTSELSSEVSATPTTANPCDKTVTNGNDSGAGSLRQAIADACAGGVITFSGNLTINLSSQITLDKNLTIDGQTRTVRIDGGGSTRLFNIASSQTISFKNLTFQNGLVTGNDNNGGGILIAGGATVDFDQCNFKANKAVVQADGGAIAITGGTNTVTISNSTFDSNQAHQGGGAMRIWGSHTVTISNSTFINNNLSDNFFDGGALKITDSANTSIKNSTFYNNNANKGAAVYAKNSTLTINNTTFSKNDSIKPNSTNTDGNGTSIYADNTTLTMNNSILANSSTSLATPELECDVIGGSVSGSNNIIEDGSCSSLTSTELSVDPKLAPSPIDNGGLTSTMILYGNSVGVNAGSGCETLDQRGIARSDSCDIGAYEFVPPVSGNLVVDTLDDIDDGYVFAGGNSLLEAITYADSGDLITFDAAIANNTIVLSESLKITKNLIIDAGSQNIVLDGNATNRIFFITGSNVTLAGLTLQNGSSDWGGAIYLNSTSSLRINDSTFTNNVANSGGGAIASNIDSNLYIYDSTFNGNQAQWGGALNIKGSAAIQNATFFANTATVHGGAIKVVAGSEVDLTYVTIAGNNATNAGGGINVEDVNATLNMTGVLLADNTAASVGNDCNITTGSTITGTHSYNLIENNECGITPFLTADPALATSLADNGGSSQTLKLLNTDSIAVDAIDAGTCSTLGISIDQRGISRPQENGCDIGAYELEFTLPTAPTSLILTPSSQTEIKLNWTDTSSDETGFKVLREGVEIVTLASNTTTFTDNGLTCGTTYNYEVYASNGAGNSTPALTGSQMTADCTIPVAPSNFTASAESNEQIRLSWTDNSSDETSFSLLRNNTPIATIAADSTAYIDSGLSCETAYTYTLYASNIAGNSPSVTVTGSSGECLDNSLNPPNMPANLIVEALSETQIKLTWLDDSAIEDNYSVLRDGVLITELAANSTSFTDTGLTCGTDYTYSIFATNQYGDSEHLTQNNQTLACGSMPIIDDTTQPSTTDPTDGNSSNSDTGGDVSTILNPPSNLTATLQPNNTILLNWFDNSDNEIGFIVGRDNRNTQTSIQLLENTRSFIDESAICGLTYTYSVMATDGNANSSPATVTIVAPLCNASTETPTEPVETPIDVDTNILTPYNLVVTPISSSEINLTWSDDNVIHSGHYIERNGISLNTVAANTHSIIDRNLHCEQTYTYSVQTKVDNSASEAAYVSVLMPACPTQLPDNMINVDSEGNPLFNLTILTVGEGSVFECGQQCVQEYAPETEVFLTANPALNWEFIGWTGACDESGRVVIDANQQCTANFAAINNAEQPAIIQAEVILQLDVEGEGSIQNCGKACTYVYPHGTNVVLNPIPAQGWTFKDWRGLCNFGYVLLKQDITLCTAVFELLPDLSQAEAPQNTDTIPIENGQINNGNIPQNGSVSHIHFIGNNQNNGLVSSVTIGQNAYLQGGRLSGSNTNYGTVQDVNIRPYSELQGGHVAGDVQNDGTLRNVTIEKGATLTGEGTLGGTINNGGAINNMVLEPDTIIIGGELSGVIVGDFEQPARIGDVIIKNAVISNMCITPTVELGGGVTLGENVTLPNTEGNLTILDFCVYPIEVDEIDRNDLAGRVEPAAFSTFTPEMMKELPPKNMALLTEDDLTFLDTNAVKQMTDEQFDNILLESLKGLTPAILDVLPVDIVKNMTAEQLANLNQEQFKDETGDKTKQSRAVTKLLTNISKQVLEQSGINPADLLPEGWQIDSKTQEIKPPVGSHVVYKSFKLQNKPENLNMPEVPDFSSGFGINGEGTPLIDNLNQGLGQTQISNINTQVFRPEDVSKFRFKQKDNSVLNVVGTEEFSDFLFSFLPDISSIQQVDSNEEVDVGLTQVEGGFLQITMPNGQQFIMIPSPDKPDELHAIFGEDAIIQINDKGEVFITYIDGDIVRFLVIMFNAFVENDTNGERLTFIADIATTRSRHHRAIREGRVVFSDGSAQNVYPAVLYPEVLIGLLSQIGAENVIYNVDGTFSLSFNGQALSLLPTYDTQVQGLDAWERIDPSINVEGNELVYSVQDTNTSQLVVSRLVISF